VAICKKKFHLIFHLHSMYSSFDIYLNLLTKELFERKWFQTRSKQGKFTKSPWQVLLIGKELVSIARREGDLRLSFLQCIELKEQVDI
jgi:hypothetical protein